MRDLQRKIGQIARTPIPILIEGDTGTGKEALARHIHAFVSQAGTFTRYVCSSGNPLPMVDDTTRGGGWIFFKYVDRLDSTAQERLLTIIGRGWGEGAWERVMSSSSQPLDFLVAQNRFNPALYHHLAGARVALPQLRERYADIPVLFEVLVQEHAANAGVAVPVPSDELLSALGGYTWPGNVLELSNFAALFAVSGNSSEMAEELRRRSEARQLAVPARLPLKEQVRRASRELESGIILRTLENHRWNRRRTAETLNISYRSLLYKMKACNLRGENTGGEVCK
jgi:DNA-binding NtrC family response regulator